MEEIRAYRDEEKPPMRFDEDDRRLEWDAASSDDELPFEIPRD